MDSDEASVHTALEMMSNPSNDHEHTIIGMDTAISIKALSAAQMPSYSPTTRPAEEVLCSLCDLFEMSKQETPEHYFRAKDIVTRTDLPKGMSLFMRHLQTLLSTFFGQVADYIDRRAATTSAPCNILGGIIGESTVADILSASRQSLTLYHKQCEVLRKELQKAPEVKQKAVAVKIQKRRKSVSGKEKVLGRRRLSSVYAFEDQRFDEGDQGAEQDADFKQTAQSFVCALREGVDTCESERRKHSKRRPSSRVVRPEDEDDEGVHGPGMLTGGSSPIPHVVTCGTSAQDSVSPVSSLHAYQVQLREFKLGDSNPSEGSEAELRSSLRQPRMSKRLSRRRTTTHVTIAPEGVEERLASLRTLQYFDIISQTLTTMLCFVYEWQIKHLTDDGEGSGAARLAEWCVCRIIEEMYEDGVDPTCPLDLQFLFCVQGLAFEDGMFHYRRLTQVDLDVLEAVWGEAVPKDVQEGRILTKHDSDAEKRKQANGEAQYKWYEWGVFTKPGFAISTNGLYTGPRLNPSEYGFRLGPYHVVESLRLNEVSPDTPLRMPSFIAHRPGEHLLSRVGEMFQIPNLTLSAPPEGSTHQGANKAKPHIKPRNPHLCKELELKYKMKRKRMRETRKREEKRRKERRAEAEARDGAAADGDDDDVSNDGTCASDYLSDCSGATDDLNNSCITREAVVTPDEVDIAIPDENPRLPDSSAASKPEKQPGTQRSKDCLRKENQSIKALYQEKVQPADNDDVSSTRPKPGKSEVAKDAKGVDVDTPASPSPGDSRRKVHESVQQFKKPDLSQKERCCVVS